MSAASNSGFDVSAGALIMFLDSDVYFATRASTLMAAGRADDPKIDGDDVQTGKSPSNYARPIIEWRLLPSTRPEAVTKAARTVKRLLGR